MLTDHDQDVLPRCRRLRHEINFGYCRRESGAVPCRLILNCWWERFDVRSFLAAHLTPETMGQVETANPSAPAGKVQSLFDLVEQTKARMAMTKAAGDDPGKLGT